MEFYNFVSSLPILFQTHFYNEVIEVLKKYYLNSEKVISAYRYDRYDLNHEKDYLTDITLNKKDKIFISFFDNFASAFAPKEVQFDKIIKID